MRSKGLEKWILEQHSGRVREPLVYVAKVHDFGHLKSIYFSFTFTRVLVSFDHYFCEYSHFLFIYLFMLLVYIACSTYQVQSQWEKRVLKSLNSMCMELGQSLAKPRCQNEQQELLTHWNDLSNLDMDLSLFRPVYSPKVCFH